MAINIVYTNGNKGCVTADMLDYLLENKAIISFKRHDGWVRPGCDKVRSQDKLVFSIPERRLSMNVLIASDSPLPVNELH